jgi:hypothetical protein
MVAARAMKGSISLSLLERSNFLMRTRFLKSLSLFAVCMSLALGLYSNSISERVFINRGFFQAVDSVLIPALAINSSATYDRQCVHIPASLGDTLLLMVVNNDTVNHAFALGAQTYLANILPGDSALATIPCNADGLWILHDPSPNKEFAYLGAAAILHVEGGSPQHSYYWNIHEFQVAFNTALVAGQSVDFSQYYPDYFTVNGRSYPDTETDNLARLMGAVGDTLHIHVANTGKAVHSIHFHGYHFRIIQSSKSNVHLNWIKDSMPIFPMETMTLEMVPDKPGMYPVHDHNLLSITGAKVYPKGLMMMIEIQ